MTTNYLDIFNGVMSKKKNTDLNDKILIIDGLNTFMRSHAANPLMNDNGIHIGGIVGFLSSIGYAIKLIQPTRVIIVFDGKNGSQKRLSLFPEYKANRKNKPFKPNKFFQTEQEERQAMKQQLMRLMEYLNNLPVQILIAHNCEADDIIAYLVTKHFVEDSMDKYIMSSDQDFLQLVSKNITVWSPTKKIFFDVNNFTEKVGMPVENFLMGKVLMGDAGDGIPGIKGMGYKTLQKHFPLLLENTKKDIFDVYEYSKFNDSTKYKIYKEVSNNLDKLKLNYELMQLHNIELDEHAMIMLNNALTKPINSLNKLNIYRMVIEDMMNTSNIFKDPDTWLRTVWTTLDFCAKKL